MILLQRTLKFIAVLALMIIPLDAAMASETRFDATGQLTRLTLGSGWLDLSASVKIPEAGWATIYTADAHHVIVLESNARKHWQSRFGDGEHVDIEITQTVAESAHGLHLDVVASAFRDSEIEGVFFWIDLPTKLFREGSFQATGKDGLIGQLPGEFGKTLVSSGQWDSMELSNRDKSIQLAVKCGAAASITLQDSRKWNNHFSVLIEAHHGALLKGQTVRFGLTMSARGEPDRTPAEFELDTTHPHPAIRGLGGNYCFNLNSIEKELTLTELKPQFARTEISLTDWCPQRGAPPSSTSGKLPLEFELMRDLAERKIPYIASVWKAPEWMTRHVEHAEGPADTVIPAERLQESADAIADYLLYAKDRYQSEPDFVSFNEPDYGAQIKFTPEEHRDAIKALGEACVKRGLKTLCLLGDVSSPRTPLEYLRPTLDDPIAMKFVGALSFHAWGGGTRSQYGAWGTLAQSLNVPLIVAEAGIDPGAWKDHSFRSFENAMREMAQYQDLFRFAHPQSVLYWEYTSDYSLLSEPAKTPAARENTERFALQKHWLHFIPSGSEALDISGDSDSVALSAFQLKRPMGTTYTLNLSNAGWSRKARVRGIPPGVKALNVVRTSRGSLFQKNDPIAVTDGIVEIELPAQSLTTLTTLNVDDF